MECWVSDPPQSVKTWEVDHSHTTVDYRLELGHAIIHVQMYAV